MGIPFYFKYLTQKYSKCMNHSNFSNHVDYFFLDCNSIIYDSVKYLQDQKEELNDESVITQFLFRIWEYVQQIKPQKVLFLALDGVCPLSKMKQQKARRYKTAANSSINDDSWNTLCITPGTPFMNKCSKSLEQAFAYKEKELNLQQILISTSDEVGEGEHKLFAWLRQQPLSMTPITLYVYGMDADLIMLSLLHLKYVGPNGQLWVFREPPPQTQQQLQHSSFNPSKPSKQNQNRANVMTFIDIVQLGNAICQEMKSLDIEYRNQTICEYIFLCFFLGNDFLPHFPSLNIRTHGIAALIETYHQLGRKRLISLNGDIQWIQVKNFIHRCALYEHDWLLQEYKIRDKMQNQLILDPNCLENILDNAPILMRGEEKYINPFNSGWCGRYYECLFKHSDSIPSICRNYLEGLQWVFLYYTKECPDWNWQYRYSYPPLLTDLNKHFAVPKAMIKGVPMTTEEQQAFILPPKGVKIELQYHWSFCRYLWEGVGET